MRRQFHTVRRVDLEGHERSLELAQALAVTTDPDTMEKLVQIKALLDSVGGQVYIAAFRTKYRADGTPVENVQEPGKYETDGYLFQYEHIAKINRQDVEPDAKPEETPDELPEVAAALDAVAEAEDEPEE
jgi:hypothetical protein